MRLSKQYIAFFFSLIAIYTLAFFMCSTLKLPCDLSWLMFETQRLLAGGSYTQNFFETNPPLILYLYIPPVLVVKFLGISKIIAMNSYIALLATSMLYLCYILIKKISADKTIHLTIPFIIILTAIFFIVPVGEFGQREHLVVIFAMPYLLLTACRLENKSVHSTLATIIGIFAGLGFALKPYFLFAPVLIEIYCLLYTRNGFAWRRPEIISMLLIFALNGILLFALHPDYVFLVAPLVLRVYYAGFSQPWSVVFFIYPVLFCYFTGLFYLLRCYENQYKRLNTILFIGYISALFGYLSQGTAWYSHLVPVLSYSYLLLTFSFIQFLTQKTVSRQHYIFAAVLGICAVLFIAHYVSAIRFSLFVFPVFFFGYFAVIFAVLLYYAQTEKNFLKLIVTVTFSIAVSFLFSYMIQRTEYSIYRFSLTILLLGLLFSFFISRTSQNKCRYLFSGLLAVIFFAYPCYYLIYHYQACYQRTSENSKLINFMRTYTYHKSIYTFALVGNLTFPDVDLTETNPTLHMEFFFWLPALIHADTPQKKLDKQFFVNMVTADLIQQHPDFIFVDASQDKKFIQDAQFDFVSYFLQDSSFRKVWKSYRYFATVQDANLFGREVYKLDVYKRV